MPEKATPPGENDARIADSYPNLLSIDYRTLTYITGPLIFVERVQDVGFDEMVDVITDQGERRLGRVLEVNRDRAVVQVFAGTRGLGLAETRVRFTGSAARLGVSLDMLGRTLDGSGNPIDDGPPIIPQARLDINGLPINPVARDHPSEFIQTGIAAIDGLNTLVRGQKLPIFSGFGLPANELAAQIAAQARVLKPASAALGAGSRSGKVAADVSQDFAVVFAAMGITHREASFFKRHFEDSGALDRSVLFLNLADDPTIERLLTPRAALTTAEFLAFEQGMHVLVIMTDMTNYCEALREVSSAREEVPGRRGYPGYMYTDLATLYERAGRIRGRPGSVTQLIILSMPDDDITHPIPDLTGYITEGQIVLSREMHRRGVKPPVDALPCLSRLMNAGIGPGKTREDHRSVADQLYAFYAKGRDLRRLTAIVGEGALSRDDQRYLDFAERFEQEFINQGSANRPIGMTLDLAWELLSAFPIAELKRIKPEFIRRYRPRLPASDGD